MPDEAYLHAPTPPEAGQTDRERLMHMLVSFSGADDDETAIMIALGEIIARRRLQWPNFREWADQMLRIYPDDEDLREVLR